MSSFPLLKKKRFAPLFWVQFLGAFNDNLFKNALVLLVAFQAVSEAESGLLVNLASGLFILPFFLFSAWAGQLADKWEKSRLIRMVKVSEIGIMILGGIALAASHVPTLLAVLFLMGTQSAVFGPVKFGVLPQHLREDELMAGNGLVEMGTFLAILLGTIGAGILMEFRPEAVAGAVLVVAVAGWVASRNIPLAPAQETDPKIAWNPLRETANLFRLAARNKTILRAILGISWFWFFGATILAQIPNFAKYDLGGNKDVVTLLLAVFSISIGVGSLLSEKLSRKDIEIGLVPFGAIGMTLFCADLFFLNYPEPGELAGIAATLGAEGLASGRLLLDIAGLGIFGSFFIVPLYALIQDRAEPAYRSRTIAANNVFNAGFMVASALMTMGLYAASFTTTEIFLTLAVLNLLVSGYIFSVVPEFAMRFFLWLLASTIYNLRYEGRERIPRRGPALIVANHVSFIDWLVITAACRRPVRFVMYHKIFNAPVLKWIFKACKAIPIAPARESEETKERAFERIAEELRGGQVVCIFPEGGITDDGRIGSFRPGMERILAETPVPVVPMGLKGLWGSFFSRKGGGAMKTWPKPSRRTIGVAIGESLEADASASELEAAVGRLIGENERQAA